ncbi:MAG TPA: hypothetical protein VEO00_13340 [Actinomycetota bacterium]|nr:hypothetical protein [Actinomycetota bacterium]
MGLDSFAARSPEGGLTAEDERAFAAAEIDLCGGMYSDGTVSFRGKVYSTAIEPVSGVSIYQRWIAPPELRAIAEAFDRCDPETVERWMADEPDRTTAEEVLQLRAFFDICRDRGLGLVGWW